MISAVTTAQVGTTSLTATATVGLIVLLFARELADTGESEFLKLLRRNILVFATPLLVVFATIGIVTLRDMLS